MSARSAGDLRMSTRLCKASSLGDVKRIEALLQKGCDVNFGDYDGRTALHLAASCGHLEAVKLLIQHGATLSVTDRWGGTPLDDAVRHQHADIIEFLKSKGALPQKQKDEVAYQLIEAACSGNLEMVQSIVEADKSAVTFVDYDNRSPLHVAAASGHHHIVEYLLSHSAKVNAVDRWGGTPLEDAVRHQHDDVAKLLQSHGGFIKEHNIDPHIPHLLSIYAKVLASYKPLPQPLKDKVQGLVASLALKYPKQITKILASMKQGEAEQLMDLPQAEDDETLVSMIKAIAKERASIQKMKQSRLQTIGRVERNDPDLTVVDFSWSDLHPHHLANLAQALLTNTHVEELRLDGVMLGLDGCKQLQRVLKANRTITLLSISTADVGKKNASFIAKGLEKNKSVTHLDLSFNNLGREGTQHIAQGLAKNTTLKILDLSENNIGRLGTGPVIASLISKNSSLTSLDLHANDLGNEGAFSAIVALKARKSPMTINFSWNGKGNNPIAVIRRTELNEIQGIKPETGEVLSDRKQSAKNKQRSLAFNAQATKILVKSGKTETLQVSLADGASKMPTARSAENLALSLVPPSASVENGGEEAPAGPSSGEPEQQPAADPDALFAAAPAAAKKEKVIGSRLMVRKGVD